MSHSGLGKSQWCLFLRCCFKESSQVKSPEQVSTRHSNLMPPWLTLLICCFISLALLHHFLHNWHWTPLAAPGVCVVESALVTRAHQFFSTGLSMKSSSSSSTLLLLQGFHFAGRAAALSGLTGFARLLLELMGPGMGEGLIGTVGGSGA